MGFTAAEVAIAAASRQRSMPRALTMRRSRSVPRPKQNGCPGIVYSGAQPPIRPSWIQRNIRSTSPHDAESGHHPIERPFHANSHATAGADAELRQVSSEPVRPEIEVLITHLSLAGTQRLPNRDTLSIFLRFAR